MESGSTALGLVGGGHATVGRGEIREGSRSPGKNGKGNPLKENEEKGSLGKRIRAGILEYAGNVNINRKKSKKHNKRAWKSRVKLRGPDLQETRPNGYR